MALTEAQLTARAGRLGSSDMNVLMGGDIVKIDRLWREKTGELMPEDLSDVWPIQLGVTTEPLNLDWYERKSRSPVTRRGEVVVHWLHDWAICTLDGWIDQLNCPIECKHVGGREPWEVIRDRYFPQCQWQCEVTGAEQCALSVIMGTNEPFIEFIDRDYDYIATMVERGELFMQHVRNKTPPVDMPAVPAPADVAAIYDMTGNNEWAAHAATWLELRESAELYEDTAKLLKNIVPADAKKCFGYGIQITRNRAGHLSLREFTE